MTQACSHWEQTCPSRALTSWPCRPLQSPCPPHSHKRRGAASQASSASSRPSRGQLWRSANPPFPRSFHLFLCPAPTPPRTTGPRADPLLSPSPQPSLTLPRCLPEAWLGWSPAASLLLPPVGQAREDSGAPGPLEKWERRRAGRQLGVTTSARPRIPRRGLMLLSGTELEGRRPVQHWARRTRSHLG